MAQPRPEDSDIIILSNGREIYANGGIIGINESLEIYGGYDQGIILTDFGHDLGPKVTWNKAERKELAEYVISLWQKFAALVDEEVLRREL